MSGGRGGLVSLAAGLALIAAVNGWILAKGTANRSGEPEARVELTERELSLPGQAPWSEDDSGLSLRLQWQGPRVRDGGVVPVPALEVAQLRELGFDVHVLPADPRAPVFYAHVQRRPAFVALEMEGEGWHRYQARWEDILRRCRAEGRCRTGVPVDSVETGLAELRRSGSRLVAVDVGKDPEALRRRHPDRSRVLILPAEIALALDRPDKEPARLGGSVAGLLVERIHVPRSLRPVLDAALAERAKAPAESRPAGPSGVPQAGPRYRAVVAVGRSWEPWLVRVERIQPAP